MRRGSEGTRVSVSTEKNGVVDRSKTRVAQAGGRPRRSGRCEARPDWGQVLDLVFHGFRERYTFSEADCEMLAVIDTTSCSTRR